MKTFILVTLMIAFSGCATWKGVQEDAKDGANWTKEKVNNGAEWVKKKTE